MGELPGLGEIEHFPGFIIEERTSRFGTLFRGAVPERRRPKPMGFGLLFLSGDCPRTRPNEGGEAQNPEELPSFRIVHSVATSHRGLPPGARQRDCHENEHRAGNHPGINHRV